MLVRNRQLLAWADIDFAPKVDDTGTNPSTFGMAMGVFGVEDVHFTAVERTWHVQDSQGQILALSFR